MTLAEYMEQHGLSDSQFARRAGMHRTEVWNYRTGKRIPRAGNVAKIEEATKRKVQAKDLQG